MATAPEPSAQISTDLGSDLPASSAPIETTHDDGAPTDTHSTRLMLTTAAHFVQQHLHSQLAELGLTPLDLSVLSGLAELREATAREIAEQCLLSESVSERSLIELTQLGFVETQQGVHRITDAGASALADARTLEDALFAETSTTLRLELSSLISRLRDGGVLDAK
ncbi:helix-turn-helix domain-containing protein [Arthrobacter sp.]|uniref:helix-turn-helix domain-containing protein n=1 Tax=Arthrobacter sp. TaxID=1667 RepID=UPI0028110C0A|nr:helix-turn-helix domain-containing protein [Arthrobacter sp.]